MCCGSWGRIRWLDAASVSMGGLTSLQAEQGRQSGGRAEREPEVNEDKMQPTDTLESSLCLCLQPGVQAWSAGMARRRSWRSWKRTPGRNCRNHGPGWWSMPPSEPADQHTELPHVPAIHVYLKVQVESRVFQALGSLSSTLVC